MNPNDDDRPLADWEARSRPFPPAGMSVRMIPSNTFHVTLAFIPMKLGLVSNCWKTQLDAGSDLESLIDEGCQRGFSVVELRQTCMGRFEQGEIPLPDADAITVLPQRFPGVRFNVAVQVPFLSSDMTILNTVFVVSSWAAQAVAGETPPHLRLVDLTTVGDAEDWANRDSIAERLAELTRTLIEIDGVLSVEHSRQPWEFFRTVFNSARERLGTDADRLRLCYDPCNLLVPGDDVDPNEVTGSLAAVELSMVHFKQRCDGRTDTRVGDGDIDWKTQAELLAQMNYAGPGLFEVTSSEALWDDLEESIARLMSDGFKFDGRE
jgi:hypothetical protein